MPSSYPKPFLKNMNNAFNNRNFKGIWIPKEIYLDDNLSWTEKILLLEIDSLDDEEEHCFASNEYFSNFLRVSKQIITAGISKLKKLGLVEEIGFDGRTRTLKSNLKLAYNKSCEEHTRKVVGTPQEKLYSHIYNNNIGINTNEYIKEEKDKIYKKEKEETITLSKLKNALNDIEKNKPTYKSGLEKKYSNLFNNVDKIKNNSFSIHQQDLLETENKKDNIMKADNIKETDSSICQVENKKGDNAPAPAKKIVEGEVITDKPKRKKHKQEWDYSFIEDEELREIIKDFIKYKDARKEYYLNQYYFERAINGYLEDFNYDPMLLKQALEETIKHNWSGLFKKGSKSYNERITM